MPLIIRDNFQTKRLDELEVYFKNFDGNVIKVAYKVAVAVFDEIRVEMLTALQFYPPVPPGSRYKRTFRLKRGWIVDLHLHDNVLDLVVTNTTPYTGDVVGRLTTVQAEAEAMQEWFHRQNGWPLALNTTRFWFDKFRDAFIKAFIAAIIKDIKGQGQ